MVPILKKTFIDDHNIWYDDYDFNNIIRYAQTDDEIANYLISIVLPCSKYEPMPSLYVDKIDIDNCVYIIRNERLEDIFKKEDCSAIYQYMIARCFVALHSSGYLVNNDTHTLGILYRMNELRERDMVVEFIVRLLTEPYYYDISYRYESCLDKYENDTSFDDIPESILQAEFETFMVDIIKAFISIVKLLKILDLYKFDNVNSDKCEIVLKYIYVIFVNHITYCGCEFGDITTGIYTNEEYFDMMFISYYYSDTLKNISNDKPIDDILKDIANKYIYKRKGVYV